MSRNSEKYDKAYYRAALRSLFVSLFWVIVNARKKRPGGLTLQALAKAIGSTKHEVSRWFNGDPNWTLNTVANLAHALDVELIIQARERTTGIVYTPAGVQVSGDNTQSIATETATSGGTAVPRWTAPREPNFDWAKYGKPPATTAVDKAA